MTRVVALFAIVGGAVGCPSGGDEDGAASGDTGGTFDLDVEDSGDTEEPPTGWVRLVHVAPTEGPASLYVDGQSGAAAPPIAPLGGTRWRQVRPGARTFQAGPEGGTAESSWASLDLTIEEDERFTIAIVGSGDDIRLIGLQEDVFSIPKDKARYSFLWASREPVSVDLWETSDEKASTPVLENLAFGKGPVPLQRDVAEWTVGVDLDRDGSVEVEFTVPDLGARKSVPLYFVIDDTGVDGTDLVMVGLAPGGGVQPERQPLVTEKASTP